MKTITKRVLIAILGALFALCFAFCGIAYVATARAETFASNIELSMLSGASARKDAATPGLKFTAEITDYDASYDYGMTIIPAEWLKVLTFNDNYIEVLDENVGRGNYALGSCTPYQKDGKWYLSLSLVNILRQNFTRDFIGIAFVTNGTNYKYASFTDYDNARSISYVAEMAIKNDKNLTSEEISVLSGFVNADPELNVSAKEYIYYSSETGAYTASELSFGGSAEYEEDNYALAFNVNTIDADSGKMSYVSVTAFENLTEISFKAKVDATKIRSYSDTDGWFSQDGNGTVSWWGLNVFGDIASADIYTNMLGVPQNTTDNEWAEFKYVINGNKCNVTQILADGTTITAEKTIGTTAGSYYVGIIGAKGEMTAPIYFDDFKVVANGISYTDDFNDASAEGVFTKRDNADIVAEKISEGSLGIKSAPAAKAKVVVSERIKGDRPLVSKNTYSNITSVEYDIFYSSDFAPDWAGFFMLPSYADIYSFAAYNYYYLDAWVQKGYNYHVTYTVSGTEVSINCVSSDGGRAYTATKTLTSVENNYLAFFSEAKNQANTGSYTISNFKVVADGITYESAEELFDCTNTEIKKGAADERYSFENLLAGGGIAEYLKNGGYASICGKTVNLTDLPESTLALEGSVSYTVSGNKEFAIVLGGTSASPDYLFVNENGVSFYNDTVKSGVTLNQPQGKNVLYFSLTKSGRLLVKLNDGEYKGLGNVTEVSGLKIVGLGGDGTVLFDTIDTDVYYATVRGGVTRTYDYADFDGTNDVYEGIRIFGSSVQKEDSNGVLKIDPLTMVGGDGNKIALATSAAYENVTEITFDMKVPSTLSNAGKWQGFALANSVGDAYAWIDNGFSLAIDAVEKGEWYSYKIIVSGTSANVYYAKTGEDFGDSKKTFTVPSGAKYFFVCYNPGDGNYNATDIYEFDNFVIKTAANAYTDDFNDGTSKYLTASKSAGEFKFETGSSALVIGASTSTVTNKVLAVNGLAVGGDDRIAFKTKDAYDNITEITFDAQATADYNIDWWGIGVGTGLSAYDFKQSLQLTTGKWYSYKIAINGTSAVYSYAELGSESYIELGTKENVLSATDGNYVYLCFEPSGKLPDKNILLFDNFRIATASGIYTEDFTDGATAGLFEKGSSAQRELSVEEIGTDIVSALEGGNVGSLINDLGNYFYGADFVTEGLGDNQNVLFGSIAYEITGDKKFAVILGENASTQSADFLLVTSNAVSFYKVSGGKSVLVKTIDSAASAKLSVYLTKKGKLVVNNGGANVVMGTVDNLKSLKVADLFGSGSVDFTNISLKTRKFSDYEEIDGVNVPYYSSDKKINFTAYAPPTVENWAATINNPELLTPAQYRLMAEAGFTKALALYEGRSGHKQNFIDVWTRYKAGAATIEDVKAAVALVNADCETDALKALDVAERYGIKYYVLNNLFFEMITNSAFDKEDYETLVGLFFENNGYTGKGAYAGNFLQDEPSADSTEALEKVKAAAEAYLALYPNGEPYVNLLPGGATNAKYTAYLDYYFDNLAGLLGYASFDDYVLDVNGKSYSISEYHLSNLMQVASRVKSYNDANVADIALRTYVYALSQNESGHDNRAISSVNDIRFQVYSALCFGSTEFTYYCYAPSSASETDKQSGLIDFYTGETTDVYGWAKTVNNEVHAFESALTGFKWKGVMTHDYKKYFWESSNKQFKQIESSKLSSYKGIAGIGGNVDCLTGVFEDASGNDAYVIMNYGDPKTAGSGKVEVTLNDATHALVYVNGERTLEKLTGGKLNLTLGAGEGVFVIPFNAKA